MADIYPFRGVTYSREKVGDISLVATQPYDKIDPSMQKTYHERHPYNIARIIKGLDEPGDNEEENRYSRAARYYGLWRKEGILQRATRPAIYPYYQTFTVEGAPERLRRGFIALGRLVEFGEGVRPHERTLAGPKADRLRLLRATRANFGQIFMLYSDPESRVEQILSSHTQGPPMLEARDDYGVLHQVWEVTDEAAIRAVQAVMKPLEVFIADGHHRYEVALSFRDEMRAKGVRSHGEETPERRMMTFINMEDKGLTI
ncbi:MAG: DUF1015 family protein, partial [Nitrospinota bacterium]